MFLIHLQEDPKSKDFRLNGFPPYDNCFSVFVTRNASYVSFANFGVELHLPPAVVMGMYPEIFPEHPPDSSSTGSSSSSDADDVPSEPQSDVESSWWSWPDVIDRGCSHTSLHIGSPYLLLYLLWYCTHIYYGSVLRSWVCLYDIFIFECLPAWTVLVRYVYLMANIVYPKHQSIVGLRPDCVSNFVNSLFYFVLNFMVIKRQGRRQYVWLLVLQAVGSDIHNMQTNNKLDN